MFECIDNSSSPFNIITIIIITIINIIIIIIIVVILIIIIIGTIMDVLGTRCQGFWPMVLAIGADQVWRPVLLASGVNSAGQWRWPVVLPSHNHRHNHHRHHHHHHHHHHHTLL
jgi:hypothetical protein